MATLVSLSIPHLLFVLLLQLQSTEPMEHTNITGSVGFRQNITVFIVNDSVTWYTAREACSEVILGTKFTIRGQGYWNYLTRAISQLDGLSDSLIWISRIKSSDDNVVYHGDTCSNDTELTAIYSTDEVTDEPRCFVLDTASPGSYYGLDNCFSKHPYLCVKNSKDNTQREEHYNVMLTTDDQIDVKVTNNITTHARCIRECDSRFGCIATIFTESTGICERFMDTTSEFNAHHILAVSNSTSENIFQAKPGKRAFIEVLEPSSSRSLFNTLIYSCTNSSSTTTEPPCDCSCQPQMTVNSSELKDWIVNMTRVLTVNSKQLSSFTRRLTSAEDNRPSCKAFGALGVMTVCTVIVSIVGADIVTFVAYVRKRYRRFTRRSKIFELI